MPSAPWDGSVRDNQPPFEPEPPPLDLDALAALFALIRLAALDARVAACLAANLSPLMACSFLKSRKFTHSYYTIFRSEKEHTFRTDLLLLKITIPLKLLCYCLH